MDQESKALLAGLGLGVAGLLLFALVLQAADGFEEREALTRLDVRVAEWMGEHVPRAVFLTGLVLAFIGSGIVLVPLVVAAGAFAWSRGRRLEAVAIPTGAALLQGVVLLLKWFFGRPRPDVGLAEAPGLSFPSGHAAFGAYFAAVLIHFAVHDIQARRRLPVLVAAAAWALLQAAGRVVIGVHYVSDVLAGLGVGLAVGGFGLAAAATSTRVLERVRGNRAPG